MPYIDYGALRLEIERALERQERKAALETVATRLDGASDPCAKDTLEACEGMRCPHGLM